MRSLEVTATARILPDLISGSAAASDEKLMVTAPVATSVTAGAEPRYGTCSTLMSAMLFISSPANCCGLPTPDDENDSLPAIGLGVGDQFLGIVHRRRLRHHDHARHDADQRQRRQFAAGVVGHLVLEQMLIDRDLAGGRRQKRVTIGRGLRDRVRGDHGAGAGAVFDDHRLAEFGAHRLGQKPRHDVDAAAGGIADKDADRMIGIAACAKAGLSSGNGSRARQKISSVQHAILHDLFYFIDSLTHSFCA